MNRISLVPGRRCAVGYRLVDSEVNGPVIARRLTDEEMADVIVKYGPPKRRHRRPSPLAELADPVIQEKNGGMGAFEKTEGER